MRKIDIKNLNSKSLFLIITGLVITAMAILFLCLRENDDETADVQQEEISPKVLCCATLPTIDCLPIFVAYEDSIFSAQGLEIRLLPLEAGMDCDTALIGGSAHIGVSDVIRAQRMIRKRVPLDFLSATDQTYSLMTAGNSRIRKIKDFDSKIIGISRFSATDFLAEHAIDSVKLNRQDVYRAQINDLNIRMKMLANSELDGAVLPEPQATEAENMKSLRCADFKKFRLGVIVMRTDLTDNADRKKQLQLFRTSYNMAVDSINIHGIRHYRQIIGKYCHVKNSTVDSLNVQKFIHFTPVSPEDVNLAQIWLNKH